MGGKVPKVQVLYPNPPSFGKITIRREIRHPVWGSAWLERVVGPKEGLLSSPEAAAYLEVSLVWLYRLIKQKKLRPRRKEGHLIFQFRDLRRYKAEKEEKSVQKRKRGRAWLEG